MTESATPPALALPGDAVRPAPGVQLVPPVSGEAGPVEKPVESGPVPIVDFRDFSCTYPGQDRPVLSHLDLAIPAGQFVVLAGASGVGKTTLALAMNGILQHVLGARCEGEVIVNGMAVADRRIADLASTVGILFQEPESQFVSLYVRDEIVFGPENLLLPREEILRRMKHVMSRIGIEGLADRFVYELSGGQKQKVGVASILAMEPRVLVLDEPAANLDPSSSREMWELTARLRDDGLTVIVIANSLDLVLLLADRLIVLDGGNIKFDGPPREVIAEHGRELLDDLGMWLPQTAELETLIRASSGRRAAFVPFTPAEALDVYADYPVRDVAGTPGAGWAPGGGSATTHDGAPLLEAAGLGHVYPDGTTALRRVDLQVRSGEVVALCGANGSGKTTLVKHFVGLLKPTTGEVRVFGKETRDLSVREIAGHVGFVFQDPEHQFVRDTVVDEIRMSLRVGGYPPADHDALIAEVLGLLGLTGLETRHPFSLSGGQKRRLSVATAVVTRPQVLILDEPTYAQDRRTTIEMMRSVMGLVGQHNQPTGGPEGPVRTQAVILVSHDMRLVADYATRAVVVESGAIAFDGTPLDLFDQPDLVRRTRLEVPPFIEFANELRRQGRLRVGLTSLFQLAAALS
jgi:energy-coupling factor transporter ATP-binding protein EcfA2